MTIQRHLEIESANTAQKWIEAENAITAENNAALVLRENFGDNIPVWEVPIKTKSRLFLYEKDAMAAANREQSRDNHLDGTDYEPKRKWLKITEKGLPGINRRGFYPPTVFSDYQDLAIQAKDNGFKMPV